MFEKHIDLQKAFDTVNHEIHEKLMIMDPEEK